MDAAIEAGIQSSLMDPSQQAHGVHVCSLILANISIYLSVCLSVYLSIYLSIYIYTSFDRMPILSRLHPLMVKHWTPG